MKRKKKGQKKSLFLTQLRWSFFGVSKKIVKKKEGGGEWALAGWLAGCKNGDVFI